ncbi:MAG: T9SS type A sorting domain-containing protein [Chitinophagales bacterium]|nr:T9SS type A sorting domain-containing protein [Chitinophagaceae bacterium]MCB9065591.1 T9SS type A sorting domain-containing protein [Chitinophagales bacterium]
MKILSLVSSMLLALTVSAQTIPQSRLADWSTAGYIDTLPTYTNTVNILNYGGSGNGTTPNDNAIINAITALGGAAGIIYFPAGDYLFNQQMVLNRDSVIIKGDGVSTRLLFDLSGSIIDAINIPGTMVFQTTDVAGSISKDDTILTLSSASSYDVGDHLLLSGNDSALIASPWAYNTVGQILKVVGKQGNDLTVSEKIRRNYSTDFKAGVSKLDPVKGVGIECLYIERIDSTSQQTNNIHFNRAAECWVVGVESNKSNFAHVAMSYSTHITVRGCYFHHAHSYGESGRAYGALLQYTSGDCLVENNIFEHLRHSMLVQAGANGNVISYNYSFDTHWDQAPLPSNSAGDMVCHGNYPYLNLFEGNIGQNIIVDDSHGINGPYNTFFRNRAELYGVFMNNNPASDSVNYVGNEITNTGASFGLYFLNGNGHLQHANNVKGSITPIGTGTLAEKSLYLTGPPGYWSNLDTFSSIGTPHVYNQGTLAAKRRAATNAKTDCRKNPKYVSIKQLSEVGKMQVYPNPIQDELNVVLSESKGAQYTIYTISGIGIKTGMLQNGSNSINCSALPVGWYTLSISSSDGKVYRQKLVKLSR